MTTALPAAPAADRTTSKLDKLLTDLIAKQDGVKPEEVTVKYIHDQRVKKLYRTARYTIGSNLGGYSTVGLTVRSEAEIEESEARINDFLSSFIR